MTAVTRIKRALTYQAVDACFSTQPTISVFALNVNRSTFDACNFTFGDFHQFAFEAMRFDPAQVHTQQHVRPVLSLGTTRASLNFNIAVVLVHLAREHATELKYLQLRLKAIQFALYFVDGVFIVFFDGHIQQVFSIAQTAVEGINGLNNGFQRRPLATQLLRAVRVIPDIALSQFVFYFFETLNLVGVVKDTP